MEDIKKDDYVTIIENENHPDYVRKNYGRKLQVSYFLVDWNGVKLYKIKGIENYALESDISKQ